MALDDAAPLRGVVIHVNELPIEPNVLGGDDIPAHNYDRGPINRREEREAAERKLNKLDDRDDPARPPAPDAPPLLLSGSGGGDIKLAVVSGSVGGRSHAIDIKSADSSSAERAGFGGGVIGIGIRCNRFFNPADNLDGRISFEVFEHLLNLLDGRSLLALNSVSKSIRRLSEDEKVWSRRVKADWGNNLPRFGPLLQAEPVQDEWGGIDPNQPPLVIPGGMDEKKMNFDNLIDQNGAIGRSSKQIYVEARNRYVAVLNERKRVNAEYDMTRPYHTPLPPHLTCAYPSHSALISSHLISRTYRRLVGRSWCTESRKSIRIVAIIAKPNAN